MFFFCWLALICILCCFFLLHFLIENKNIYFGKQSSRNFLKIGLSLFMLLSDNFSLSNLEMVDCDKRMLQYDVSAFPISD